MATDIDIRAAVGSLFADQRLGILATQGRGHPYCNLVAFTPADDLGSLLIATPRDTAKYANMLASPGVSLLVDNRCGASPDFSGGMVATCIGRAAPVPDGESEAARQRHFSRHPALRAHLDTPDCVLVRIAVERYIVARGVRRIEVLEMI